MPNRVITDLGSPFMAIEFRSWAQDCGISIDYALVTHPEANGQVERANSLILAGLKPDCMKNWKTMVPNGLKNYPK
jgi:transposase InsO family protein